MFKKTIEAVKAAEKAAQSDLDALYVKETGTHWHAAGSGILQDAVRGLAGLREDLEKRQAPINAAQAEAEEAEKAAAKAAKKVTA